MATDAFGAARGSIAELFEKFGHGQGGSVETQLDADEDLVSGADGFERDDVRAELAPGWRRRLSHLITNCPGAEDELSELVERLHAAIPQSRQEWVQNNTARDNGTVYAALGGNVHVHPDATRPDAERGQC